MAHILVVNSSPRANSNTRALSAKFREGAEKKGHAVTVLEIGKAKIHPCIGCETCHTKTPGKCIFTDDMTPFYEETLKADVIIFSSPVYYFTINAQMKAFIDRTYAVGPDVLEGKSVGGIFAYGDVDAVKSGCINAIRMFQDICSYVSARWVGAVYGTAWEEGDVLQNTALLEEAFTFGEGIE